MLNLTEESHGQVAVKSLQLENSSVCTISPLVPPAEPTANPHHTPCICSEGERDAGRVAEPLCPLDHSGPVCRRPTSGLGEEEGICIIFKSWWILVRGLCCLKSCRGAIMTYNKGSLNTTFSENRKLVTVPTEGDICLKFIQYVSVSTISFGEEPRLPYVKLNCDVQNFVQYFNDCQYVTAKK